MCETHVVNSQPARREGWIEPDELRALDHRAVQARALSGVAVALENEAQGGKVNPHRLCGLSRHLAWVLHCPRIDDELMVLHAMRLGEVGR
jgi:hypothetical protein